MSTAAIRHVATITPHPVDLVNSFSDHTQHPTTNPIAPTMSTLRQSLGSTLVRPFLRTAPRSTLPLSAQRLASSDYGSGTGDPVGDNPLQQGVNPSADLEHPGPPPPKVGQGSGSTPTKGTAEGHSGAQNQGQVTSTSASGIGKGGQQQGQQGQQGQQQKRGFSTAARARSEEDKSREVRGAKPTILAAGPPPAEEQSADVREHNRQMDNRAEQAHGKVDGEDAEKDKVDPKFWSGEFAAVLWGWGGSVRWAGLGYANRAC